MFSNKHTNNTNTADNNTTTVTGIDTGINNHNINDYIDTSSTSDMNTFVDPRLQYNMTTPVTSYNPLSSIINNNNNNNPFYHLQQQPQFSYDKYNGSTTSLASSINSDITLPTSLNNNILSKQFMNLLIETYQFLCSDPTITPFDTNNPPSGILNRVGKISLQKANSINMEIFNNTKYNNQNNNNNNQNVLLSIIRHNLLSEIRKEGYYSRNVSLVSLPQPSLFNNNNNNNSSPLSQLPVLKRTDTMDRLQNNIFNVTGINNPTSINTDNNNTRGTIGLGTGLDSSIHLNSFSGTNNSNSNNTNANPLLSRSSSRTSSPLATRTKNL